MGDEALARAGWDRQQSSARAASRRATLRGLNVTVSDTVECGGYEAVLVRAFTGTIRTHYDAEGNPARVQIVAKMEGSVTNSKTGKSVELRGSILYVLDLATGEESFSGPVLMSNGAVVKDTGRVIFDESGVAFVAGRQRDLDWGPLLCAAVA